NLAPTDLDTFSITAPANSRLPGGGGNSIAGLYDLKPAVFGRPANNKNSLSKDFGAQIEHWNGVDLSAQARMTNGLLVSGGLSTGKTTTDNCDIVAKLPEMLLGGTILNAANGGAWLPAQYCHQESGFLTQV